jgi:acyl-CoA synthetase (AMP-forming)/AMP-acid ligase II
MAIMRSKFKGIIFKQGASRLTYWLIIAYGMTETSPVITTQLANDQVDGSSGVLVPNMKAKLVDPQSGKEITKYNTPGELWVSGPNVTLGYLSKETDTNETYICDKTDVRRWLRTGDEVEVRLSEKGQEHYWIVDRIKELIKVFCVGCWLRLGAWISSASCGIGSIVIGS